jgi:hypothetical protein
MMKWMMNPQSGPRGGDNVRRDKLGSRITCHYSVYTTPVSFQDYKSTVIAFAVLAATLLLPSSLDELDKVGTEK